MTFELKNVCIVKRKQAFFKLYNLFNGGKNQKQRDRGSSIILLKKKKKTRRFEKGRDLEYIKTIKISFFYWKMTWWITLG